MAGILSSASTANANCLGKHDPFFSVDGARAFEPDLKTIEVNLLDTGHFALDEERDAIANHISRFIATYVN